MIPSLAGLRLTRLRWKLALSYATVTMVAIFLLLLTEQLFFLMSQSRDLDLNRLPQTTVAGLQQITPQVAPYLAADPPAIAAVEDWLMMVTRSSDTQTNLTMAFEQPADGESGEPLPFFNKTFGIAIFDQHGELLVKLPADYTFSPAAEQVWRAAMNRSSAVDEVPGQSIYAAVSINSPAAERLGVLFVDVSSPQDCFWCELGDRMLGTLMSTGRTAIFITVIGIVFGIISTRTLTRRIQHLVETAGRWGEGHLDTPLRDRGADELGDLARQLNRMARDLDALLQTRQQLAHLEERNRLARDLHDAVKQQVFAANMQLAAAHLAHDQGDAALVEQHLREAQLLVTGMQQELTGLIEELRPAALEGKGLVDALRDMTEDWSRQHAIAVELAVQGEQNTPLAIEQTLYRVAQEGLSNISRHSGATAVMVVLVWEDGRLSMRLEDNGRGFDRQAAEQEPGGVGLASMRERLDEVGGQLRVDSRPGQGSIITAVVPLTKDGASAANRFFEMDGNDNHE